jgi:hypothetical protein
LIKDTHILQECGLNYVWLNQEANNTSLLTNQVEKILQDQFKQKWAKTVRTEENFISYRIFKYNFGFENYLDILPNYLKLPLFEFRIGSPKLAVNNRRNFQFPRNGRLCTKCEDQKVGDEYHFLFECTLLRDLRGEFLPRYYRNIPNTLKMEDLLASKGSQPS